MSRLSRRGRKAVAILSALRGFPSDLQVLHPPMSTKNGCKSAPHGDAFQRCPHWRLAVPQANPESMRPSLRGEREYKKSVETKGPDAAKRRFATPAAQFEVGSANTCNKIVSRDHRKSLRNSGHFHPFKARRLGPIPVSSNWTSISPHGSCERPAEYPRTNSNCIRRRGPGHSCAQPI